MNDIIVYNVSQQLEPLSPEELLKTLDKAIRFNKTIFLSSASSGEALNVIIEAINKCMDNNWNNTPTVIIQYR